MEYGTLSKVGGQTVEGYFPQPPTLGQPFILHRNPEVGDLTLPPVSAVYRVPTGIRSALPALSRIQFPPEARPGDLFFVTSAGLYLLQAYRRDGSGDAA